MSSTKFSGKSKADLEAIAHISGLLGPQDTARMTKTQLLNFLVEVDSANTANEPNPVTQEESAYKAQEIDVSPAEQLSETPKAVVKQSSKKSNSSESRTKRSRKAVENSQVGATIAETRDDQAHISASEIQPEVIESSPVKEETVIEAIPATAKRGRGRPRKNQVSEAQVEIKEVAVSEVAVAEPVVIDTTEVQTEILGDQSSERSESVKTKRGRPRKSQTAQVEKAAEISGGLQEQSVEGGNESENKETKPADNDKGTARIHVKRERLIEKRHENRREKNKGKAGSHEESKAERTDSSSELESTEVDKERAEEGTEGTSPAREQQMLTGVLEIMPDNYGFLRMENYLQSNRDVYLPPQYIRRFNLRTGDLVTGPARQRDNDRYQAIYYIKSVNGQNPDKMIRRPHFDRLTPIYPDEKLTLETKRTELSTRIIDLIAPIGKGQRGMIVSPPKAGKTILLQKIANAISENNPNSKLIVLLIDERPEEVTDMQRSIQGEVVYSTFDKTPENHVKVTELVLERAERLVELGEDVIILLDSITRMGRAYNLSINPTGRTLSGGLDPGALYGPKRFFGAARNIEGGGSLTIIATALIDTGSRMDEVIFEEFKGTGNMEVYLDRKLSEKRIFPAIDINRSGTRREELLLTKTELDAVWAIRKAFGQLDTAAVTETIISLLLKTKDNEQFINSINVSFNDKSLFEAMRGTAPQPRNGNGNTSGGTNSSNSND